MDDCIDVLGDANELIHGCECLKCAPGHLAKVNRCFYRAPMSRFAPLPDPPYYAVIFTAQRTEGDFGYGAMADQMVALAAQQPGYLGVESTRDDQGLGITISYWQDENSLTGWKDVAQHLLAQKLGKTRWYSYYTLRVAKVERAYSGPEGR